MERGERRDKKGGAWRVKYFIGFTPLPPIGGRGVGNWEGDKPNFGEGGVGGGGWFLNPQGENKFRLSEGGKGGNKRQN